MLNPTGRIELASSKNVNTIKHFKEKILKYRVVFCQDTYTIFFNSKGGNIQNIIFGLVISRDCGRMLFNALIVEMNA